MQFSEVIFELKKHEIRRHRFFLSVIDWLFPGCEMSEQQKFFKFFLTSEPHLTMSFRVRLLSIFLENFKPSVGFKKIAPLLPQAPPNNLCGLRPSWLSHSVKPPLPSFLVNRITFFLSPVPPCLPIFALTNTQRHCENLSSLLYSAMEV